MTAGAWAIRFAALLDGLALLTLALAPDLSASVFGVAGLLWLVLLGGALLRGSPRRLLALGEFVLFFLALGLLVAASGLTLFAKLHPLLSAGYGGATLVVLSWLAPETPRYRAARLGIGLVLLVLASALSTEVYLFFAVFAYVLLAALALSCAFLESELTRAGLADTPLPRGYIRRSGLTALAVFTVGLVIFPILPRMRPGTGGEFGTTLGYSEEVRMAELGKISDLGSQKTALRIFVTESSPTPDPMVLIPKGLLRARVLEFFDGQTWRPNPSETRPARADRSAGSGKSAWLEIYRDALPTTVLPAPYSSTFIESAGSDGIRWPASLDIASQWQDVSAQNHPVQYTLRVKLSQSTLVVPQASPTREDTPQARHLSLAGIGPSLQQSIREVVQALPKATMARDKVSNLDLWFARQGFQASYTDSSKTSGKGSGDTLADFLTHTKAGHCELFAAAGALILRSAGVPTRLVTGFRIARAPVRGILLVRGVDAHAWLEYWDTQAGWVAWDPTPRVFVEPALWESFRDAYDLAGTYWSRYVIGFGSSGALAVSWDALRRLRVSGNWGSLGQPLQNGFWTRTLGLLTRERSALELAFVGLWVASSVGLLAALALLLRGWPREVLYALKQNGPARGLRDRVLTSVNLTRLIRMRHSVEERVGEPYPFTSHLPAQTELAAFKREYDYLRFGPTSRDAKWYNLQPLLRIQARLAKELSNRGPS